MNLKPGIKYLLWSGLVLVNLTIGTAHSSFEAPILAPQLVEEDCFNGIDDDGDGWTDGEDVDCFCAVELDTINLILNPSFSDFVNDATCDSEIDVNDCFLPSSLENGCVANWINANSVPSAAAYFTSCYSETSTFSFPSENIFQSGDDAFVFSLTVVSQGSGFLSSSDYIGGALATNLIAGTAYELTVQLNPLLFSADTVVGNPALSYPLSYSLYGNTTGNNFPYPSSNARCPTVIHPNDYVELANFELIAFSTIQPWTTHTVQFIAPADIENFIFGTSCAQNPIEDLNFYTFTTLMDNFQLREVVPSDTTNLAIELTDSSIPCSNETILQATPISGATYQWYLNNEAINNATSSVFSFENVLTNAGEYVVTVIDNMGGCGVSQPLEMVITLPLEVGGTVTPVDCYENATGAIELSLSNTDSLTFSWTDVQGVTIGNSPGIENLSAGNYSLEIVTEEGCIINEVFEVTQPDEISFLVDVEDILCEEKPGQLSVVAMGGTPTYSYSIDGTTFQSEPDFELPAGTYDVMVMDANFCEQSVSEVIIEEPEEWVLQITPSSTVIQLGETVELNLLSNRDFNNAAIVWTPQEVLDCASCAEVIGELTATTDFQVVVATEDCAVEASIVIEVEKNRNVFIPNIFSPNGDGSNDWFEIYSGIGVDEIVEFKIFDRWGALIFDDSSRRWDGNFKNEPMNNGVYVWWATVRFKDGVEKQYQGSVNLIR